MPDEELLDLAVGGRLKEPAVLEQQVRRMLASPRARAALVDNFVAQWLQLRPLRSAAPSDAEFPDFDDNLREAFRQETNLLRHSWPAPATWATSWMAPPRNTPISKPEKPSASCIGG